jgi:hypothetical protein
MAEDRTADVVHGAGYPDLRWDPFPYISNGVVHWGVCNVGQTSVGEVGLVADFRIMHEWVERYTDPTGGQSDVRPAEDSDHVFYDAEPLPRLGPGERVDLSYDLGNVAGKHPMTAHPGELAQETWRHRFTIWLNILYGSTAMFHTLVIPFTVDPTTNAIDWFGDPREA